MTEVKPPPGDPEWRDLEKEFLDRRDFEILRFTYSRYMSDKLSQALGWGELTINNPQFPEGKEHKEVAKSLQDSSREIKIIHDVLSTINYNDRVKKFGDTFIFDIDGKIANHLNPTRPTKDSEFAPQGEDIEGEKIPDRFTIFQHTVDHYLGNDIALSTQRIEFEFLDNEMRDIPEVYDLVQKTNNGILQTVAVKDAISNLSPNASTASKGTETWYKLDDEIEARFNKLHQTFLHHRQPD